MPSEYEKQVQIHRQFLRERKEAQKKKRLRAQAGLSGMGGTIGSAASEDVPTTRSAGDILLKKTKKRYEKGLRERAKQIYGN